MSQATLPGLRAAAAARTPTAPQQRVLRTIEELERQAEQAVEGVKLLSQQHHLLKRAEIARLFSEAQRLLRAERQAYVEYLRSQP